MKFRNTISMMLIWIGGIGAIIVHIKTVIHFYNSSWGLLGAIGAFILPGISTTILFGMKTASLGLFNDFNIWVIVVAILLSIAGMLSNKS